MSSRILLINFTQKEIDKIKDLPIIFDRGYISNFSKAPDLFYYFPLSIHEYQAIFINLRKNSEITKEFLAKSSRFSGRERTEFVYYWLRDYSPIVVFLDDYDNNCLYSIGAESLFSLEDSTGRDKTINIAPHNNEFDKFFAKNKNEIIMPTKKYIKVNVSEGGLYSKATTEYALKNLYSNMTGDLLGCYHDNAPYGKNSRPSLILLPQFHNPINIIGDILKEFAKIYPKLFSEILSLDWEALDQYYPKGISKFDGEIDALISLTNERVRELTQAKNGFKDKYSPLINILTKKDEELKQAVIAILRDIFNMEVIDADKEKAETLPHEDIIIKLDKEEILVEVKGDNSPYPSTRHIGQLWKHLSHNKRIDRGALILNYDIDEAPEKRNLAYTGEESKDLEGIIFIDTRTLHSLSIAVIDHDMPVEEATKILLNKERVVFNLDEYINSKEAQKEK